MKLKRVWLKAFPRNRHSIVREHEDANVGFEVDETLLVAISGQYNRRNIGVSMEWKAAFVRKFCLTMRGDCTISLTLAKPPHLKSRAECKFLLKVNAIGLLVLVGFWWRLTPFWALSQPLYWEKHCWLLRRDRINLFFVVLGAFWREQMVLLLDKEIRFDIQLT